ncbi:hypothetical protein AK830_g12107 [Neonectria ditissima]|uniref:Uncharacterized protein n=1 Tax=Neonectria ditissima TaxID=78410 RepID=A0A0P7AQ33_9HYPO|nr:hypothetical protein AK830_g12107 [Neonectria ditissima]
MSHSATDAARFMQAMRSDTTLNHGFLAVLFSGHSHAPASPQTVNSWLHERGFNTTLAAINTLLTDFHGNSLDFWQASYNTQFIGESTAGPAIVIKNGTVVAGDVVINDATLLNGVLSWEDNSNSSNGQLEMSSLSGIVPALDPSSPTFSLPSPGQLAKGSSAAVPNAYIGPQFQGFYWGQGESKPIQANIQGRQGRFPLPASIQSPQGPLQASTISQWAATYQIYTPSSTSNDSYELSPATLAIDASGNVMVDGTAINSPELTNDVLQWNSASGNSTSAQLWMRDNSVAGTADSISGNEFCGCFWASGTQQPTTVKWFGFASLDTSPSGQTFSPDAANAAVQNLTGWADVVYLSIESTQLYLQMQMGEMIMNADFKVLSTVWNSLGDVGVGVRDCALSLRRNVL